MSRIRADWISSLLVLLSFAVAALLYGDLPERVPVHFDALGDPDRFVAKPWGPFLTPLLTLGAYLLLRVLPAISPRGYRMDRFIAVYWIVMVAVIALLFITTVTVLLSAARGVFTLPALVPLSLGLLFVILGNYMGKLERNFFVGIRTPWTLANEEVWARTHRMGGKLFVLLGVYTILVAALTLGFELIVAGIILAAAVSVGYSFVVYLQVERAQS